MSKTTESDRTHSQKFHFSLPKKKGKNDLASDNEILRPPEERKPEQQLDNPEMNGTVKTEPDTDVEEEEGVGKTSIDIAVLFTAPDVESEAREQAEKEDLQEGEVENDKKEEINLGNTETCDLHKGGINAVSIVEDDVLEEVRKDDPELDIDFKDNDNETDHEIVFVENEVDDTSDSDKDELVHIENDACSENIDTIENAYNYDETVPVEDDEDEHDDNIVQIENYDKMKDDSNGSSVDKIPIENESDDSDDDDEIVHIEKEDSDNDEQEKDVNQSESDDCKINQTDDEKDQSDSEVDVSDQSDADEQSESESDDPVIINDTEEITDSVESGDSGESEFDSDGEKRLSIVIEVDDDDIDETASDNDEAVVIGEKELSIAMEFEKSYNCSEFEDSVVIDLPHEIKTYNIDLNVNHADDDMEASDSLVEGIKDHQPTSSDLDDDDDLVVIGVAGHENGLDKNLRIVEGILDKLGHKSTTTKPGRDDESVDLITPANGEHDSDPSTPHNDANESLFQKSFSRSFNKSYSENDERLLSTVSHMSEVSRMSEDELLESLDVDTVVVETMEYTTEEVDPETSNVTVTTHTYFTEIETSQSMIGVTLDESSQGETLIHQD